MEKILFSERGRRGREFTESFLNDRKSGNKLCKKRCLLQTKKIVYIELKKVK